MAAIIVVSDGEEILAEDKVEIVDGVITVDGRLHGSIYGSTGVEVIKGTVISEDPFTLVP